MTQTLSPEPNKPSNKVENWLDAENIVYVVKRILQGLLTILLASILSFIIIQLAPGDYLDTLKQNPKIAEETIKQLTNQFGLDKPWYVQYWRWFVQVVTQLDFGTSFVYNRSVASLLGERIPATLLLAISSIIITWLIAIPLGILSAVKQSSWTDKILRVVSLNHTELSPIGKILDIAWHMILPTIALSITSFAGLMRLMRGQMLDVMRQDYIQTARAKGLPEDKVIYVHGLRNAINPLITLLGFEFASLLGGSFIAEFFFNWPGLGRLILQAVTAQDLYLVM